MPSIKFNVSTAEEYHGRQITLRQGISLAELARRGFQKIINSPASDVEMPEAVVDQLERRNGQGKRITACYLSPPLAGAVRKLAREQNSSQSHVVRELLRHALRERGLLTSKAWGAADHLDAAGHIEATADAPQARIANEPAPSTSS